MLFDVVFYGGYRFMGLTALIALSWAIVGFDDIRRRNAAVRVCISYYS